MYVASDRLDEIAVLGIDDETIRRHVHRAAADLAARREAEPPGEAAAGNAEFLTDGVMASTRSSWREVKLARFQARHRGEAAGWIDRHLPAPTASACYATTADAVAFSVRWAGWAEKLGIDPAGGLTVLADGAAWIWSAALEHFPATEQVLDIFQAPQHIASAAGLFVEGPPSPQPSVIRG